MISPDSPLAAAALSQIWQVTALILVVSAIVSAFCKRRPHLAHVLWLLAIVKCLTPPVWSSPTSLFSWLQADTASSPSENVIPVVFQEMRQPAEVTSLSVFENDVFQASDAGPDLTKVLIQVLAVCWFSGVAICGCIGALRWLQFWRKLRRYRGAVDPALVHYTAALARRLGLRRHVRLIVTSGPHGPAALGVLAPTVLLPAALADKAPADLEPVLAHELIHLRRGDNLFGALQALVQILWWFHPLVWRANRHASRAVERCCDEEVVAGLGCPPATYARCLLDVLELKQSLQAVSFSPGMRPAEVTAQRLENIMKRANGFHRRTPKWCWALLALAVALVLPGREIVYSQNQAEAQAPVLGEDATSRPPAPTPQVLPKEASSKTKRVTETIRVHNALAADVAAAVNDFFTKRQEGKKRADGEQGDVVITPEPISNHLLVSALPENLAEVKRLVAVLDIFPKQFLGEMTVCEGEPVPTVREAMDKGKINVLSRPMFLTVENQTVLVNVGKEIEFPPGSGKTRQVGIILQVTVGRANNRQVPVRIVNELASVSKDGATLNIQHMEHSANYPTGERVRIRGGMTESGKELWFDMTITEITSREQLQKLMSRRIGE